MGRTRGRQGPGIGSDETVSRPILLDTSFLVALERETASGEKGPARRFLPSLRGRRLVISIVSVEQVLEGACCRSRHVRVAATLRDSRIASRTGAAVCSPAAP